MAEIGVGTGTKDQLILIGLPKQELKGYGQQLIDSDIPLIELCGPKGVVEVTREAGRAAASHFDFEWEDAVHALFATFNRVIKGVEKAGLTGFRVTRSGLAVPRSLTDIDRTYGTIHDTHSPTWGFRFLEEDWEVMNLASPFVKEPHPSVPAEGDFRPDDINVLTTVMRLERDSSKPAF